MANELNERQTGGIPDGAFTLPGLTSMEDRVVKTRFGVGGERAHTLEETCTRLCLPPETVRQEERSALRKLRQPAQIRQLKAPALHGVPVSGELPGLRRPADRSPEARRTAKASAAGRILVLDDEQLLASLLASMLGALGYEATTVGDGTEAVEVYRREMDSGRPFDAVILDLIVRGGMGGRETFRRLREIDSGVRAIISSGSVWEDEITNYEAYGFLAALGKPYGPEELAAALGRTMLRQTLRRRETR